VSAGLEKSSSSMPLIAEVGAAGDCHTISTGENKRHRPQHPSKKAFLQHYVAKKACQEKCR